jgi:hypothetical protein
MLSGVACPYPRNVFPIIDPCPPWRSSNKLQPQYQHTGYDKQALRPYMESTPAYQDITLVLPLFAQRIHSGIYQPLARCTKSYVWMEAISPRMVSFIFLALQRLLSTLLLHHTLRVAVSVNPPRQYSSTSSFSAFHCVSRIH